MNAAAPRPATGHGPRCACPWCIRALLAVADREREREEAAAHLEILVGQYEAGLARGDARYGAL